MSRVVNLGPVGFNPTGVYDITRQYKRLDVVEYQGSSYVAKDYSIGQLPTNTDYWDCIAVGTLKQFTYNSVAEMKADTVLEDGMFVETVGYYSANDGSGAEYRIRTKTNDDVIDNYNIIDIGDNLIAEKIINDEINKNFDIKLGTSTWYQDSQDAGANTLQKVKIYFDSIIQCHRIKYDSTSGTYISNDSNISEQIVNINNYINNGGSIAMIKFHQETNFHNLLSEYGASTILNAYTTYVLNFIDALPYKDKITKVCILNEAGTQSFSLTYSSEIISALNRIKTAGYEVSTPYANAYALCDSYQAIIEANDFISLNCYPFNDIYGENSSIKDVARRFNNEFYIIERYIKNKDLYITEFGCSSAWSSFSNPSSYEEGENGKPISLFLEGFFKSKFVQYIKGAWWWYYADAINYASDTLISIKNNKEIRYYGE